MTGKVHFDELMLPALIIPALKTGDSVLHSQWLVASYDHLSVTREDVIGSLK